MGDVCSGIPMCNPSPNLGDGDQWRRRCRCGTSDDGPVGGDHLHRHYSFIGVEQGGIDALGALGHHLGCDLGDPRRCCGVDAGHIVWYTTAASPAAAPTSATNTTVAATNADRADTPQFDVSLLAMAGTSPSRSCRARHTAGARVVPAPGSAPGAHSELGALTAVTMLLAEVTGDAPDYGRARRRGILAISRPRGALVIGRNLRDRPNTLCRNVVRQPHPPKRSSTRRCSHGAGHRTRPVRVLPTGTGPGSIRCRWPAMRWTTCR